MKSIFFTGFLLLLSTLVGNSQPCNPIIPNADWDFLVKFAPSSGLSASAAKRGHEVQTIFDASGLGKEVNLDYYGITISRMPLKNGKPMLPAELLERVRLRLASFLDRKLAKFEPLDKEDIPAWQTGKPGTLMLFRPLLPLIITPSIRGIERITPVMYVPIDSKSWRFVTVSPHPVSGTREFGIRQRLDQKWEIYTRGVDRITYSAELKLSDAIFGGADDLWESFQDKISADIRSLGGDVSDNPVKRDRFCWANLLKQVQSNTLDIQF